MLRILSIMSLSACALAANAQQAASLPAGPSPAASASVAVGAQAHAAAVDNRLLADGHPFCLRDTGSRIRHRSLQKQRCVSAPGRSYSREDLQRTGASNTADALRMLDPALR